MSKNLQENGTKPDKTHCLGRKKKRSALIKVCSHILAWAGEKQESKRRHWLVFLCCWQWLRRLDVMSDTRLHTDGACLGTLFEGCPWDFYNRERHTCVCTPCYSRVSRKALLLDFQTAAAVISYL